MRASVNCIICNKSLKNTDYWDMKFIDRNMVTRIFQIIFFSKRKQKAHTICLANVIYK